MNNQLAVKVTKTSKLPNDAAKFTLFGNNLDEHFETNGRILTDSRFSWLSVGPQVTIINNQNGSKKNIWRVNNVIRDNINKVTCVSEIPAEWPGGDPLLAIGCEEGSLHIYHSGASRILRTVQFNENVVSIEVVDMGVRRNLMLPEELQLMNGILAVGLRGGAIYLIDLCRNQLERCLREGSKPRNDMASQLLEIDLHNDCETEIREKRSRAIRSGDTLALLLNESALAQVKTFSLPSRTQSSVKRLPREEVSVTCLKYLKEIACLAAGFNFSCIQLWHLPSFTLLFVSPLMEEVVLPVVGFCLQEPSDDPRNVCYLWSVHQSSGETSSLPLANMYLLNFDKKRYIRDYGSFYEEFRSCALRYELDLGDDVPEASDGRIISCHSIAKAIPRRLPHYFIDQEVEESVISICAIAWEVWTPERFDVSTKLTIFDLNQWYKAQMPNTSMDDHTSYMVTLSLGPVNQVGALLDVKISPSSVRQFVAVQPLEEHYFPASLTFDCSCLTETEVFKCSWLGIQQESLNLLDSAGPSALLNPSRLFHNFLSVGLRASFCDIQDFASITTETERQILLSIMLEHGFVNYLKDCVRIWADGCQSVANCTLPALLHWAWEAATFYKRMTDNLCIHLFDYSGGKPDIKELVYCIRLLHTLSDLFNYILKNYRSFILEKNLESKSKGLLLIVSYLDSVLWCIENKFLPEMHVDSSLQKGIPYNLQFLQSKINSRRTEVNRLSKLLSYVPKGGLLLIDAFIWNEACGSHVTDQWEREGGGLYPPPSIQSMLRVNLMNGIPAHVKHCIMLYFLMDITHELPKSREYPNVEEIINKFAVVFRISDSRVNIMKGFWCIDNKKYEVGLKYLSSSQVFRCDLTEWQHRAVLRSLYIQHEPHLALRYLQIMSPPLSNPEDIKFELSLLLECELFLQAFEFQRRYKTLQLELLNNFFYGCMKKKQLGIVYKLSLNKFEEEAFTLFLENAQHPHSEDLRVLYLLSRARYVEAIDVNEKMRTKRAQNLQNTTAAASPLRGSTMKQRNVPSRFKAESRENIRDVIVSGFAKTLPPVTRELADYCLKHKSALASWKQVERPTPLSVVVHTVAEENKVPVYKGTSEMLMQSALMKTREIWAPLIATPAQSKSKFRSNVEDTPFLRSAVFSKSLRHSLEHDFARTPGTGKKRERDELVCEETAKRFRYEEEGDVLTNAISFKDKSFNVTSEVSVNKEIDEVDLPLLRTPHIKKKVISVSTPQRGTPQSILKSPWKGKGTPKGRNTPVKDSPITFAKDVKYIDDEASLVDGNDLPNWSSPLPRQIRFSLPNDSKNADDLVLKNTDSDTLQITPRSNRSFRTENLDKSYDDYKLLRKSHDSFTLHKTQHNKKEVYDIDDSFDEENDLDDDIKEHKYDDDNFGRQEQQTGRKLEYDNELPNDVFADDKNIIESDTETFVTVSSLSSATVSSNRDSLSVSSDKRLSAVKSNTMDDYASVSDDDDNKDTTVVNKSSTTIISEECYEAVYENSLLPTSENDQVKDKSRVLDSSEEGHQNSNDVIENIQSQISEPQSVELEFDNNEFVTEQIDEEENDKLNSSTSFVSSVKSDYSDVKTYASLKTVDDFSLNEADEAALDEALNEEDENNKNESSDAEIKTSSPENFDHEEIENEFVKESNQIDEEYVPEEMYNNDLLEEDEVEEEDDDDDEEDEDIYAGLDDEGNEDEKNVSGSSDIICLDSDSGGTDRKATERYSEELDYDDYEREDFAEEEEVDEDDEEGVERGEEIDEEEEEYNEEVKIDNEEGYSSEEEEEEDDDDDDDDDEDDNDEYSNGSEASGSVKSADSGKNIDTEANENVTDNQGKLKSEIGKEPKDIVQEIFVTETGKITCDIEVPAIPVSIERKEGTNNELEDDRSKSNKVLIDNEETRISDITEANKENKDFDVKMDENDDSTLHDRSEDQDVIKLQITTTDIYDDSSVHEGNLSVILEESTEMKIAAEVLDDNERKLGEISVPSPLVLEDVHSVSKVAEKSDLSIISEETCEINDTESVLDIDKKVEGISDPSSSLPELIHNVSKITDKSDLPIISEEPAEAENYFEKSLISQKSVGERSVKRRSRRSKSFDDLITDLNESTKIRKSLSFTGAENLCDIKEVLEEQDESKAKEEVCFGKKEIHHKTIQHSTNEDSVIDKNYNCSQRSLSSKISRSRRSSSVSQLSELSSRYHSRSSRGFGSTSSLLLEMTKSHYSSDSNYGSTSKLDTSLGSYIKKLKKQNQSKPQQSSLKSSSLVSYRSSIKKKTSDLASLPLKVLSSSEDEGEGHSKDEKNKSSEIRNSEQKNAPFEGEGLEDKVVPTQSKQHNRNLEQKSAPFEGQSLEDEVVPTHSELHSLEHSEQKTALFEGEGLEDEVVQSIAKHSDNDQEGPEIKIDVFPPESTIPVEIEQTTVHDKNCDVSKTSDCKEANDEHSINDHVITEGEALVEKEKDLSFDGSAMNTDESINCEQVDSTNIKGLPTTDIKRENIEIKNKTTYDVNIEETAIVGSAVNEDQSKNSEFISFVDNKDKKDGAKTDFNEDEKISDKLVVPSDVHSDSVLPDSTDINEVTLEETLRSTDINEVTLEETLRSSKRKTRASSVVSDITSIASDRSNADFPEKNAKLNRRKSISFSNVNDDKSAESRRYSSRRTCKSNILDLLKGVSSYTKCKVFDPHQTRASSISSIDENTSTVSHKADDSRRKSIRRSRFMDRSSLRQSILKPVPLDVVSSDDETETVSYTENIKKGSAFTGLLDTIVSKKGHSSAEGEEKRSLNVIDSEIVTVSTDLGNIDNESKIDKTDLKQESLSSGSDVKKSEVSEKLKSKVTSKRQSLLRTQKSKTSVGKGAKTEICSPIETPTHSDIHIASTALEHDTKSSDEEGSQSNDLNSDNRAPSNRKKMQSKTKKFIDLQQNPSEAFIESKTSESNPVSLISETEKDTKLTKYKKSGRRKVQKESNIAIQELNEPEMLPDVITTKCTKSSSDDSDSEIGKNVKSKRLNKRKSQKKPTLSPSQESVVSETLSDKDQKLPKYKKANRHKVPKESIVTSSQELTEIDKLSEQLSAKDTKSASSDESTSEVQKSNKSKMLNKHKTRKGIPKSPSQEPVVSETPSKKDEKLPKHKKSNRRKLPKETVVTSSQESAEIDELSEQVKEKITKSTSSDESDSEVGKSSKSKHRTQKEISKSPSSVISETLSGNSSRKLRRSTSRKHHSTTDLSKSSKIFDEPDSELIDTTLVETSPVPSWKKVLRSSKLLDVHPKRQSKLIGSLDFSLEIIPSEEEEEDDEDDSPRKKSKPSPEGKFGAKKKTAGKTIETEVGNDSSSSTPGKRKRSSILSSTQKKKKLLLSDQHDDTDYKTADDNDRLSIRSEPARSSVSAVRRSGRKSINQHKELHDIVEQPEEERTPKRSLRSNSIITDTGSADSKLSNKTVTSDILPKRRSLFSTPKKTPDHDSSIIDDYTTQRRLTRHQKSLLERSLDLSSSNK